MTVLDLDESGAEPDEDPSPEDTALDDSVAPPPDDRRLRRVTDVGVVAACAGFVFWQLHPDLLLADTTPAGGDMGAHVWAFGYLRDVLIPDLRLAGWTPDWYAGFPVFQFYMVVPFVVMVVLNAGFTGAAGLLALAGSAAIASRSAGVAPPRAAPAIALVTVAFGVAGVWSGWGPGVRFSMLLLAVSTAVLAGAAGSRWRATRVPYARVLAGVAVLVAILGIALPYGTSFKLVSVAGVVAMPASAYLFGRLARFPYPTPALLAIATVAFLFDKNFTIYGGNIASTLAGEFAFSISLALAIAYLGVLVHGLRTGTHRATAAVLLALVGLCHLIPAFFALAATAIFLLVHVVDEIPEAEGDRRGPDPATLSGVLAVIGVFLGGVAALALDVATLAPVVSVGAVSLVAVAILAWTRRGPDPDAPDRAGAVGAARTWWLLSTGAVAGLLASWWVLPFFLRRTFLNDMGWGKIAVHTEGTKLWDWFTDSVWPELVPGDLKVFAALALVGAVLSIAFRNRVGSALVLLGLLAATAFVFVPQGRLWNARLLPFWYLVVYFLAAVGVGEVVRAMAQVFTSTPGRPARVVTWIAAPLSLLVLGVFLGGQLRNLPGGSANDDGSYRLFSSVGIPGVFSIGVPDAVGFDVSGRNFVTDWSRWNYSGYERKDAYPEYRSIVATMADVGEERGCGMSLWEYNSDLNDYGTPMALMLLPHWTDGCIGSMEGLYFEASSTTPFHFLMQSELSAAPSRAQRDMPYRDLDIDAGVEHMQLMGVRYYLAKSAEANAVAAGHPDLTEIAASGPWMVYEVADAPLVEPLSAEPAVTTASDDQHEWLCAEMDETNRCSGPALDWFQDPSRWNIALAADGPEDWQRVEPGEQPTERPLSPAAVSDVEIGRDGISFSVDRPGTPVLVKQSYFPNWEVSGAEGPYRVAPNLMVVVPTDTDVSLTYGRTAVDWSAMMLTLVGLALAGLLYRSGPVAVRRLRDEDDPLSASLAAASTPPEPTASPRPDTAPPPPPPGIGSVERPGADE